MPNTRENRREIDNNQPLLYLWLACFAMWKRKTIIINDLCYISYVNTQAEQTDIQACRTKAFDKNRKSVYMHNLGHGIYLLILHCVTNAGFTPDLPVSSPQLQEKQWPHGYYRNRQTVFSETHETFAMGEKGECLGRVAKRMCAHSFALCSSKFSFALLLSRRSLAFVVSTT